MPMSDLFEPVLYTFLKVKASKGVNDANDPCFTLCVEVDSLAKFGIIPDLFTQIIHINLNNLTD